MPTYVQDKATGKFVLKGTETDGGAGYSIQGDIEPFISPITKEIITGRAALRAHNAKHGVTDSRDYSPALQKKLSHERDDRATGNNPQARRERVESIKQVLDHYGI